MNHQEDDVASLLRAYNDVLAAANREVFVAWVRLRPWSERRVNRLLQAPRVTWLLEFFVCWHIERTTRRLLDGLARQVAAGSNEERSEAQRAAVEAFRGGLPPLRLKTYAALLIVAAFTLGRVALDRASTLISEVPGVRSIASDRAWERAASLGRAPTDKELDQGVEVSKEARELVDRVGDAIGTDAASVGKVLDAFSGAKAVDLLLVLVGVAFALYVVLRPFVGSFRLKRILMNTCGQSDARSTATGRSHLQRSTGVYALERRVLKRVAGRAPGELPFDLVVCSLVWLSLPLALGTYLIVDSGAVVDDWDLWWFSLDFETIFVWGAGYIAIGVCRVSWLARTWRRRLGEPRAYAPFEVELPNGTRVTVRDPLVVGAFTYFIPYLVVPWWYLASRHTAAVVHPSATSSRRWTRPTFSALAFTAAGRSLVLPYVISMVRGERRLREAESAAGIDARSTLETSLWFLAIIGASYAVRQLPLSSAVPLLLPNSPYIPYLDSFPFLQFSWPALFLVVPTAAVFATAYQRRLNRALTLNGIRCPEYDKIEVVPVRLSGPPDVVEDAA
ncbi:hypothetical protein OJ997_26510 [Solirubrobacter phytolaccae]|uniref:Uncharacterized protein n=1 Tax=Solirubrobacter phytolaccae TaxID=1404360 RepID=A0A9X3SI57_9ACTN|nr:hypothetical protein [Solirubrobacter phytolaccae]MDA0183887.1 hypothetical protein [Solirubrobacter phytolaccae]